MARKPRSRKSCKPVVQESSRQAASGALDVTGHVGGTRIALTFAGWQGIIGFLLGAVATLGVLWFVLS